MRRLLMILIVWAFSLPCFGTQYWFVAGTDPDGTKHDGNDSLDGKSSVVFADTTIAMVWSGTYGWILNRTGIGDAVDVGDVIYITREAMAGQYRNTLKISANAIAIEHLTGTTPNSSTGWIAADTGPKLTLSALLAGIVNPTEDQVVNINGTVTESANVDMATTHQGADWTIQKLPTVAASATLAITGSFRPKDYLAGHLVIDDVDIAATSYAVSWTTKASTLVELKNLTLSRSTAGSPYGMIVMGNGGADYANRRLRCDTVVFAPNNYTQGAVIIQSCQEALFEDCSYTQADGGDFSGDAVFGFTLCGGRYHGITIRGGTYVVKSTAATKWFARSSSEGVDSGIVDVTIEDITLTTACPVLGILQGQAVSITTPIIVRNNTITHTGAGANMNLIQIGNAAETSAGTIGGLIIEGNTVTTSAGNNAHSLSCISLDAMVQNAIIRRNTFRGQCVAATDPGTGDTTNPPCAIRLIGARGTKITDNRIAWGVGIRYTGPSTLSHQSGITIQYNNIWQKLNTGLGCIALQDNTSTDGDVDHYDPKTVRITNNNLKSEDSCALFFGSNVDGRTMVKDDWRVNTNNYYGSTAVGSADGTSKTTLANMQTWWDERTATTDARTTLTDSSTLTQMQSNDDASLSLEPLFGGLTGAIGAEMRASKGGLYEFPFKFGD